MDGEKRRRERPVGVVLRGGNFIEYNVSGIAAADDEKGDKGHTSMRGIEVEAHTAVAGIQRL